MADVTLKGRRYNARGVSRHDLALLKSRATLGIGNRATLTTALGGTNKDITYFARTPGTTGNAITVRYVVGGANTPLSLSLTSSAITINLATNGGGTATSTADDVINLVNRDNVYNTSAFQGVGDLVHAQRAVANDGTGVLVALGATSLTGAV